MDEVKEFYDNYLDTINRFLGLDVELVSNGKKLTVNYLNISKDIQNIDNSKFLKITTILEKVLMEFYERFCKVDYQPIYKQLLVEELAYNFINKKQDHNKPLQDFINELKDLCNKTYELESTQMGFIIINDSESNVKEILNESNIDYHELKQKEDIGYFLDEKQTLKIVDSKSICLVLNQSDCKVIGIAQKRIGESSIKDIMMNRFHDMEKKEIMKFSYDYYVRSQIDSTTTLKRSELDKLKNAGYDILTNINKELNLSMQFNKDDAIAFNIGKYMEDNKEKFENLSKEQQAILHESYNLLSAILENVKSVLTSHVELLKSEASFLRSIPKIRNNINFVFLYQKQIFWSSSNENMIIYSNGRWKLRNFFLLRNIITRQIMLQNEFLKQETLNIQIAFEAIKHSTPRIIKIYDSIKQLSEKNIGSLICLLNKHSNSFIDLSTELFVQKKLTLDKYSEIIKGNDGKILSIENCDSFLFELISSIDGAVILDHNFNILSAGEMINNNNIKNEKNYRGARTLAALAASNFGLSIKVSEDGDILIFELEEELARI